MQRIFIIFLASFIQLFIFTHKIQAQDTLKNISIEKPTKEITLENIDTNVIQILNKKNIHSFFGRKIKSYNDPTQKLSFEEIRKKEFLPNKLLRIARNLDIDTTHWYKWEIFTDFEYDTYKVFSLGWGSEINVFFEYPQQGIIITHKTGKNIPASQRNIKTLSGRVKCFLPKKQHIIIWINTKNYNQSSWIHFAFLNEKNLINARDKEISHYLILQGILSMFLLYHLVLLFLSRDVTYFYYVMYIFVSQMLLGLTTIPEYLFLGEYLFYSDYIFLVLLGNIAIWYMLFVRDFNRMRDYFPKIDLLTLYYARIRLIWVFVIVGLSYYKVFLYDFTSWIINTTIIFDIIWGIVMAFLGYTNTQKDNIAQKYIAYGSVCLFIGGGLSTVLPPMGLNSNFVLLGLTVSYFEVGLFMQLCIFSVGLGIRGQNIEKEKQIAQAQLIKELEKNEKLIKEQNQMLEEKVTQRTQELNNTLQLVEQERQKSDNLLLNILPEETAQELKNTGSFTPKSYKLVTVLFTDFKGFTNIAEKLTPTQVIENLNTCFFAFDTICEKYNLEKIKTIGDAYMCAGGLPVANETNPIDVVNAGLEMQKFMQNWKIEKEKNNETAWELRIGVHSGEVVAGVVGKNKFVYDIWGDTVNIASRMESSGEVGQVNISETTYNLVKNNFECTFRGKIQAKNKGEVNMYFVNGKL